jgi:hypothetical protein
MERWGEKEDAARPATQSTRRAKSSDFVAEAKIYLDHRNLGRVCRGKRKNSRL